MVSLVAYSVTNLLKKDFMTASFDNHDNVRRLSTVTGSTGRQTPQAERDRDTPVSHDRAAFHSHCPKIQMFSGTIFSITLRGYNLLFNRLLIGYEGVPSASHDEYGLLKYFESPKIQVCVREGIPAITGVDTRAIVTYLREQGSSLSLVRITIAEEYNAGQGKAFVNSKYTNLCCKGDLHIAVIDCRVKENSLRSLVARGASVTFHEVTHHFDVYSFSMDPATQLTARIRLITSASLLTHIPCPVMGICLGHQFLAWAAAARTIKLKYGNRIHNISALDLLTIGNSYLFYKYLENVVEYKAERTLPAERPGTLLRDIFAQGPMGVAPNGMISGSNYS
ncbi:hypothetical protein BDZ91DRAFT_772000 [Kalaharituber pfeilii]|nr:hypothetical protein BDZ91DRAFT_772000 [Kalaharituber pfeilii]